MIIKGVYKPVFMPHTLAQGSILGSVQNKYNALSDENKFPVYANTWLSSVDVESYLDFAEDVMSFEGRNDTIANTSAMYGCMSAEVFCEGLERIVKSGKEINVDNYVAAMESASIALPLTSDFSGYTLLKYQYGYRIGVTRFGLLKSSDSFDYFEELSEMQDFEKFLRTGDIADIK